MKKLYLFIAIILVGALSVKSQKVALYEQYFLDQYLMNPAITGTKKYIPTKLNLSQQWFGFEDAPKTVILSAHARLRKNERFNRGMVNRNADTRLNHGVGGYFFNYKSGLLSRTGVQASYSYHLLLDPRRRIFLSMGLALSASQIKIDGPNVILDEDYDPLFLGNVEKAFMPDADFGLWLYDDKYDQFYAGLAITQLFQFPVKLEGVEAENDNLKRHYYITGGYRFPINSNFEVNPSLVIRASKADNFDVDINCKFVIMKYLSLSLSARTNRNIFGILGIEYERYSFGYVYNYTISNVMKYNSGTHQIVIGYNIGEIPDKRLFRNYNKRVRF